MTARSEVNGRAIEYRYEWVYSDTGEPVPRGDWHRDEVLMDRIVKAIADVERVAQFEVVVCDNDCKAHIRTTWGAVIDATQPRIEWRNAVRKALDTLDAMKSADTGTIERK